MYFLSKITEVMWKFISLLVIGIKKKRQKIIFFIPSRFSLICFAETFKDDETWMSLSMCVCVCKYFILV